MCELTFFIDDRLMDVRDDAVNQKRERNYGFYMGILNEPQMNQCIDSNVKQKILY